MFGVILGDEFLRGDRVAIVPWLKVLGDFGIWKMKQSSRNRRLDKKMGNAMKMMLRQLMLGMGILASSALAGATDVTLHLNGSEPVSRVTIQYQCDAEGAKMGLPAAAFSVEYLNGAGNSLAILPVGGISLIFANVISGSGARYAAGQYIWWDAAGRTVTFSSDSLAGTMQSTCHRVEAK